MRKLAVIAFCCVAASGHAQDNYEIQVYASPTMTRGTTMVELHSNFTFDGEKNIIEGVRPSYHALHETLEVTQGISENFELGFYLFTNYSPSHGYKVVGTHLRPRISVPASWNWPVGVSLSTEFGYQRKEYSEDTWNIEVRPIIDRQIRNLYLAFNPTFGIGLRGVNNDHRPSFEPNIKLSYAIETVAIGVEYYGDLGQFGNMPSVSHQSHALFVVADIYSNPNWEVNLGPGFGLTAATDRLLAKLLIGRRISWTKKK